MKHSVLAGWLSPLRDLVTPERCRVCAAYLPGSAAAICDSCLAGVEYLGVSICRKCGCLLRSRVAGGSLCEGCIRQPPPWDQAISVVKYGPVVSTLLYRLKYNADTTVLPALTKIIQPFVASLDFHPEYILPVPLYSSRLKDRGLNQALCLAQLFFPGQRQAIVCSLLKRQRPTRPQTGLDGAARRKNLHGAFCLSDHDAVRGKSLCVVDDVYTTGTTVTECCTVLKSAGAIDIRVITLARVVVGA